MTIKITSWTEQKGLDNCIPYRLVMTTTATTTRTRTWTLVIYFVNINSSVAFAINKAHNMRYWPLEEWACVCLCTKRVNGRLLSFLSFFLSSFNYWLWPVLHMVSVCVFNVACYFFVCWLSLCSQYFFWQMTWHIWATLFPLLDAIFCCRSPSLFFLLSFHIRFLFMWNEVVSVFSLVFLEFCVCECWCVFFESFSSGTIL